LYRKDLPVENLLESCAKPCGNPVENLRAVFPSSPENALGAALMTAPSSDRRGQFIVFEGIDGVGKTTLAKHLVRDLRREGIACDFASFPGREPGTLAAHVYRLYHRPSRFGVRAVNQTALQLLLTAAHVETIQMRIRPALQAGRMVILDRFWWSTWVYGRAGGVSKKLLSRLLATEELAWSGLVPRRVFLLTRQRGTARFGGGHDPKHLSSMYRSLARREAARKPYPVSILANDGPLNQTLQKIRGKLDLDRSA
jgi:dTMP kinase